MPMRNHYNYPPHFRQTNIGYAPWYYWNYNVPQLPYRPLPNQPRGWTYFGSSKKFYCNFCQLDFNSFFHKKTHENEEHKPMGCEFCSETFRVKHDLYLHKLRCPERPGEQKVAEELTKPPPSPPPPAPDDNAVVQSSTTTTPDNPTGEMVKIELPDKKDGEEAAEKKLPCSHCIKTFPTDDALKKHILSVHTGGSVHSTSGARARLNSTKQMKNTSGPFPCPFCVKKFYTRRRLHFHMKGVHTAIFYCNVCPAEFKSKENLNRHVYNEHVSKEK